MFGQYYRISIGLDYTMKILDWIRIANMSDPFNTSVHQWCTDMEILQSDWIRSFSIISISNSYPKILNHGI